MKAFVVGFPKSGTTSIDKALAASGLRSAHWKTTKGYVGQIIYRNLFAGIDPLAGLENFAAITQADVCLPKEKLNFWPNLDFAVLRQIRRYHPECVFILNYREPRLTADSIRRWGDLRQRIKQSDIPGLPAGYGGNDEQLIAWIENHFAAVRHFFKDDPKFLELDIAAPDAPYKLGDALGVELKWWGKANINQVKPIDGAAALGTGAVAAATGVETFELKPRSAAPAA